MIKSFFHFFSWFTLLALAWVNDAYAYLDPGTGSIFLQVMVAAIAGGVFLLKTYWIKFKTFFVKKESEFKEQDD